MASSLTVIHQIEILVAETARNRSLAVPMLEAAIRFREEEKRGGV
jgi:hypothetical protein